MYSLKETNNQNASFRYVGIIDSRSFCASTCRLPKEKSKQLLKNVTKEGWVVNSQQKCRLWRQCWRNERPRHQKVFKKSILTNSANTVECTRDSNANATCGGKRQVTVSCSYPIWGGKKQKNPTICSWGGWGRFVSFYWILLNILIMYNHMYCSLWL